jgi:porin
MRILALALCCASLPGIAPAQQAAGSAGDAPGLANQTPAQAQADLETAPLAAPAGAPMSPVVIVAPRTAQPSTAPSATTPNQKVEPGGIGSPFVTGVPPIPASQGFRVPGENPGYLFNLATYGAPVGDWLADRGLYLHGSMQTSDQSVVSGGNRRVTNGYSLGYYGFDLDTEKAFGLKGGLFDATVSAQTGDSTTGGQAVGSSDLTPSAFGNGVRLVNFYYDQSFMDHAVQLTVGRMAAGYTSTPFMSPGIHQTSWYCTFVTTACGNTAAFSDNSSKATYLVGGWAATLTVHPAPHWYIKGGIYSSEPIEVTSRTNFGFPGKDFDFNEASGDIYPIQIGYITTPESSLYPTNFHIGGYYDDASFADKFLNSKGLPIVTNPGAPLKDRGTGGLFGALQQTVYRFSDDPRSTRGISLFMTFDLDLSQNESIRDEYMGGFIVTGLFPSRAADTINFLFSTESFDPREQEDRDALAMVHNINYRLNDEDGFEINYGFAAAPGIVIYPYTQYIIHPDQLDLALPNPRDTYAWSLGLRAVIRFGVLFGLPDPN